MTSPSSPRAISPLLIVISGMFCTVLVLCAVISGKIINIGGLYMPGGTVLFPIVFIFNDILTETYGYALSRRIIWTGLASQMMAAATYWLVGVLPAAPFWTSQQAYDEILGVAPRVALAGLVAYACGEFANSMVLSKMKFLQHGERGLKQGWRFVFSTIVGEAVDSAVFMILAFAGVMETTNLVRTMLTLYVVKVIYEIVALPLSTRIAEWVKRTENVDVIDDPQTTSYNPFSIAAK